jgi:hypothetical protein
MADREALLMAAEDRGPLMHARIGMLRALNRHVVREFDSSRKRYALGKAEAQAGPMTESAGPRFGGESSRKIIEVRRQSKLIINPFP